MKPDKLFLEANRKFKIINNNKDYGYYDTARLIFPDTGFDVVNRIFIKFYNYKFPDSIYLVVSKSDKKNIFWKQVFYSSVIVSELNGNSDDSENFRINESKLVSADLLNNNDTLIHQAFTIFNNNKDSLQLGDCGVNSNIFYSICNKLSLPCRIILLMGGDAIDPGYNDHVGYPTHAVCEVYSSKLKKWFIVDPTYGFIFRKGKEPLNSVEISNKIFFNTEKEITQDSVLFTKRSLVGRDYYKYYENVYFKTQTEFNKVLQKTFKYFFQRFDYKYYHYSNSLLSSKNGRLYVSFKFFMYIVIGIIHFNICLFFIVIRLLQAKKTTKFKKNDREYFIKEREQESKEERDSVRSTS